MKNKLYLLQDKIKYHKSIVKEEWPKFKKTHILSSKLDYSLGFIQGSTSGLINLDCQIEFELGTYARRRGIIDGDNARLELLKK